MEFKANEGKSVTIQAMGKTWARHALQTHFVQMCIRDSPHGGVYPLN